MTYMMQIVQIIKGLLNLLYYGYTCLNLSIAVLLYKINYKEYKVIGILGMM
jgi:hypothetical protein